MSDVGTTVSAVVTTSMARLGAYLPQFLGGLVVLLIGLIVANLLRAALARLLRMLRLDAWLEAPMRWIQSLHTTPGKEGRMWSDLIAELVRWTVVILFLIPAVDAWGLPRVTDVLNRFLLYIPNVFVAVVAGFVGFAVGNLVFDLVTRATRGLGSDSSTLLANFARYALLFFTGLVVLNQLGVAADLIRILFTGIVAMLALAGGLAFGLGGQTAAARVLEDLRKRLTAK